MKSTLPEDDNSSIDRETEKKKITNYNTENDIPEKNNTTVHNKYQGPLIKHMVKSFNTVDFKNRSVIKHKSIITYLK